MAPGRAWSKGRATESRSATIADEICDGESIPPDDPEDTTRKASMRFRSTLLPLVLLSMAACGRGEPVDREADRLLRDMSAVLEEAPRFSFAASEIRDVVDREGKTSQLEIDHRTFVERPN